MRYDKRVEQLNVDWKADDVTARVGLMEKKQKKHTKEETRTNDKT